MIQKNYFTVAEVCVELEQSDSSEECESCESSEAESSDSMGDRQLVCETLG